MPEPPLPEQQLLATYDNYPAVQSAVDHLSDEGFPVANVSIVWNGLRRIEFVTGRRTVLRAALEGALAGAWFGVLIGALVALFAELDPDVTELGVIISYGLVGALAGAILMAGTHWARRGRRDFSALDKLDAESFELWVNAGHRERAEQLLAMASPRVDRAT